MKLSDIMGNAGLAGYAEIALILFFLAFVGIVVALFAPWRQRDERFARASQLPLQDDSPHPPR